MGKSKRSKFVGHGAAGFSLIEMLVVVGIMATLVGIGYPKYRGFTASAHQSEAKNNLSHIYTLENIYSSDAETFGNMSKIGPGGTCTPTTAQNPINFKLQPCASGATLNDWKKSRYAYTVTDATDSAFTATAVSGAGDLNTVNAGCSAETWTMDATRTLTVANDASKC